MKTTKLTRKQLVMLAVAWNGSLDSELGAHVALSSDKAIVRQLEKKGLVRVTRHETKTDGHRDWWVRTTDEGHAVYCDHNKNAKAVQWQFLLDNDLVRVRWEPDPEPFDVSYVDTWTDRTPEERKEIRAEHLAIAERNGVWGIIGEFRLNDAAEWEHADSVWGYVPADGDSESDCCYLADIKDATLRAFNEAASDAAARLSERATYAAGAP